MNWFIEDVKCELSECAKRIGLVPGSVVTSIKYKNNEEIGWLYCMEFGGCRMFFKSEEDIGNILLNDHNSDEDIEFLNQLSIDELDGINLESFDLDILWHEPENETATLIAYMMIVTDCSLEDLEECIQIGKGKYVSSIDKSMLERYVF